MNVDCVRYQPACSDIFIKLQLQASLPNSCQIEVYLLINGYYLTVCNNLSFFFNNFCNMYFLRLLFAIALQLKKLYRFWDYQSSHYSENKKSSNSPVVFKPLSDMHSLSWA